MAIEIGQEVGNYRILQRLGSGGMGEVFLAEHPLIGKSVALKVIHQDMSLNRELVSRFINEAKAVSTIGNDHIVEIHDFGTTPEGANFFIMEYLSGRRMDQELSGGLLAMSHPGHLANCLHVCAQIAAGLAAAHKHNIIHRDLKPDNIMLIEKLGDPLFVKILDFGLSKVLDEGAEKLTAMGVVLGTPEFMSPEAAESKGVDGRSDIYSLGVLLFYMLCGRLPFSANSMGEMMVQHVCKAPPVPRSFNPQIPPAVEQIVLRCLAKNRADRFQTMEEVRAALMAPDQYLSSSPKIVSSDGAPHPGMVRPTAPSLDTMNIDTPPGYAIAGRRRVGTLIAVALLSGGSGVAAALVGGDRSASEPDLTSAVEDTVVADSKAPTPIAIAPEQPAPKTPPATVAISLEINSEPQGALVTTADGKTIGTTPFTWEGQQGGDEVSWRFARDGYGSMTYRFAPSSEEPVLVTLMAEEPKSDRKRPKATKRPKEGKRRPERKQPSCKDRQKCGHNSDNLLMPDL